MRAITDSDRTLLTAPNIVVNFGVDLLNTSNVLVEDISADVLAGEVARNNYAEVHGTCRLQILRELAWGKDRVRPYMTVSDGITTTRYNLGVFVMTTPDKKRGTDPLVWEVDGYDLLHLLQNGPGDTYVATSGTTYHTAVQNVITTSGIGATLRLDGTGSATTLPEDMVWCLTEDGGASWLRIINDLLNAIGYRSIYADHNGELRSEPYQAPVDRAVEWTLDTSNTNTNIVGVERTLQADTWGAPNWWRFVRKGMATKPVEGTGFYTVQNVSDGPTSQTALGRTVRKVVYLDVANQTSLVAQGDQIVDADRQVTRTFDLSIDPLPVMGHFDIFTLTDEGPSEKCVAHSWTLPLDGSPGALRLEAVGG